VALGHSAADATAQHKQVTCSARPLAQDYVTVTRTPDKRICTCGPGLVKLPGGNLFATVPFWPLNAPELPIEVHTALILKFTQFYPVPGGQNKLHVIYDEVSQLFWTPATLVTDSQDQFGYCREARKRREFTGTGGNERRILMLMYSVDALNWFQAGCIALAPKLRQSFMYACPLIDGDNLLILSRTSHEARDQHDADLCTFHRVRDFRRLALNLYPET
jgi:hypothetical protein